MLTVAEALAEIVSRVQHLPAVRVPLSEALGLVLAEDAISDLDSPPFDKALMDGYAVRTADFVGGRATLRVVEEVLAGRAPQVPVRSGEATRIMTGAPLPGGADAVVQVEHTRMSGASDDSMVNIETTEIAAGKNILKRGESMHRGTRILPVGRVIRAQEAGCLAELGKDSVSVYRLPRVAILSTGDELVPVNVVPAAGQIRNSNETMLTAQLRQMGAEPVPLGVARDKRSELCERIALGLACDVLVLSGGVSAGKLDLVPSVLTEAGIRQVFHKVKIKPGQPLWFGVRGPPDPAALPARSENEIQGAHRSPCYIFGLPGNPVSSMVCCELFTRTAVRRLMGLEPAAPTPFRARLARDYVHSGGRPTYHPARWEWSESGAVVDFVRWAGSADLCGTVEANGMALFPEGDRTYPAGTMVDVFSW